MADSKAKKNKKINQMSLKEIEEALKKVLEHSKNYNSYYAQHLLKRQKELMNKN